MPPDEEAYPGVHRAYDFVLPSYEWALDRLKSVDGRLQEVMAYAATLTIASTVVVSTLADEPDYTAVLFLVALVIFLVIVAIGLLFRASGMASLPSPAHLNQGWLHLDDWAFKRAAVYYAGKHYERNLVLVNRKGHAASIMTLLLAFEVAILVVWIIGQLP